MRLHKIAFILFSSLSLLGCSKLDEKLEGTLTQSQAQTVADINTLMQAVYNSLRTPFQVQDQVYSLEENSSDEVAVPTRGGDWDDNGNWRVMTTHNWTQDHSQIGNAFNSLLQAVFNATNVLTFKPSAQQAAEARFVRAFAMFTVLDLFGQVPYRQTGENLLNPPEVLKGIEAWNFILSEVNAIKDQLPDAPPAYKANKDAARVLLMKLYLNKGAFTNRQAPTFDAADMNQVIALADQIITGGKYTLANNVFDNYTPDNDVKSTENIFTNQNIGGVQGGDMRSRFNMTAHYNQSPSGWNGFTTLADVYDKFEATDQRRGGSYPGMTDVSGMTVGFQVGQQFNQNGVALKDRKGNPLVFTRDVKLIESGNDLEVKGIRVQRYVIDYKNGKGQGVADNDYVFYRFADVLLMKAEAILRGGTPTSAGIYGNSALSIVNSLRLKRGATPMLAVTLNSLLDERQREFYWDGWRRQDLIRFGRFLAPNTLRTQTSDPKYLYYPIPRSALAVNKNLVQNTGY
jgi:hypothetical protein